MGVTITDNKLENIDKGSIRKMFSYTLHMMPWMVMPLYNNFYRETVRNLLFVIQIINSLHDEDLIHH